MMRSEIGPAPLAAELRRIARDRSAPPSARADAVALLLGDVEAMAGKRAAADAARTVISRIAGKVRGAAAALKRFVTRSNPGQRPTCRECGAPADLMALFDGHREEVPACLDCGSDISRVASARRMPGSSPAPKRALAKVKPPKGGFPWSRRTRRNPRWKAWKPPILPGAPELKLVRVSPGRRSKMPMSTSRDLAVAFASIAMSHREAVWIALLDSKHRIAGVYMHTLGAASSSAVYPSEILRVVLYSGVERFAMAHNHPSGDPTPSADDVDITRRVKQGAELVGLRMLDSIVVAQDDLVSRPVGEVAYSSPEMHASYSFPAAGVAEPPIGFQVRYTSLADRGLM